SPWKPGLLIRSNHAKYWTSGAGLYVNTPAPTPEPPSGFVTVTSTLPKPGGVVAVSWVLDTKDVFTEALFPNLTVAPTWKPCPLSGAGVPPENGPEDGETDEILGAGMGVGVGEAVGVGLGVGVGDGVGWLETGHGPRAGTTRPTPSLPLGLLRMASPNHRFPS